ncbi:MAG: class I tRNA ligase family protein, partial [Pseudomonadota bacterium]
THAIYQTKGEGDDQAMFHYPEEVELRDGGAFLKADGRAVKVIPSAKMSKSKNNVVDPVSIVSQYGADTARWFVLSDSPPERDVEWTTAGAEATYKHLTRVHRLCADIAASDTPGTQDADDDLRRGMHRAIYEVTLGIESFGFNAAIAKLYGFTNLIAKSKASTGCKKEAAKTLMLLMAPMTPHLSEECWHILGGEGLIAQAAWPKADETLLVEETVTLPIQVNGKRRSEVAVPSDLGKDEIEKLVLSDEAVIKALAGGAPKKLIVVPGRIVNVVL